MNRKQSVDDGLEQFAGVMRSGFEGLARLIDGKNKGLSNAQYVKLSNDIRQLDEHSFHGLLEILDRYGAAYFPPSAPVEMLKELPTDCARELIACLDHGLLTADSSQTDTTANQNSQVPPSKTPAAQRAIAARNTAFRNTSPMKSFLTPLRTPKPDAKETAALQRMLEDKVQAIGDLNQQLASTIVRAQNAEADLNLYKRRLELLSSDYADMGKKLQKLQSTVDTQHLEKAELATLLRAAQARVTAAENEANAKAESKTFGPKLGLEDLKEVLAVASQPVTNDRNKDGSLQLTRQSTAVVDQAKVIEHAKIVEKMSCFLLCYNCEIILSMCVDVVARVFK